MTLAEWSEWADVPVRVKGEARLVADAETRGMCRTSLWHLDDYLVSSVSAGTIWLTPRQAVKR
jgi:hypothetical protein